VFGANGHIEMHRVQGARDNQIERKPLGAGRIAQDDAVFGKVARMNRVGSPRPQNQSGQIAPGMNHADQPDAREQKGQGIAQSKRVVDGGDQHGDKNGSHQQTRPCGQDVDAATAQLPFTGMRASIGPPGEQPSQQPDSPPALGRSGQGAA